MTDQTFLFADLAGFTALTEQHGDAEAADLATGFIEACREILQRYEASEVKTIGDAIFVRTPRAAKAVELGVFITTDLGERHGFPMVRVGMHTGPAVERDGDWFGATVNVAARVSAEASAGQVLLTGATLAAAGRPEGIEFLDRGRRSLRNIDEAVMLFEAAPEGFESQAGLPVDPVCRMAVDSDHAAGTLRYEGRLFHFCSLACANRFAAAPERYVASQGPT